MDAPCSYHSSFHPCLGLRASSLGIICISRSRAENSLNRVSNFVPSGLFSKAEMVACLMPTRSPISAWLNFCLLRDRVDIRLVLWRSGLAWSDAFILFRV